MNACIRELQADHQRLSRLLHYLRDSLPEGRTRWKSELIAPVKLCIEYYCEYSIVVHHDKEESLFSRLPGRDQSTQVYIDVLSAEHRLLTQTANELHEMARLVEQGRSSYDAPLAKAMRVFIRTKYRHMRFEEDTIYPLLEARLTMEDWKAVIAELPSVSDPLFEGGVDDGYLELLRLVESHTGQTETGRL
jgi:hemerythrin-like domain-containing protein